MCTTQPQLLAATATNFLRGNPQGGRWEPVALYHSGRMVCEHGHPSATVQQGWWIFAGMVAGPKGWTAS